MSNHMIGYVRVSTEEQERSGLGIEAQTEAILAECDRRGWTVEIMSDLGRSGKQVNPELRRALDLLDAGQADGMIVAKLDRLARSVRHASAIIDDAIRREWALVVLDNALDLTDTGWQGDGEHAGDVRGVRARPDLVANKGSARRSEGTWSRQRTPHGNPGGRPPSYRSVARRPSQLRPD